MTDFSLIFLLLLLISVLAGISSAKKLIRKKYFRLKLIVFAYLA